MNILIIAMLFLALCLPLPIYAEDYTFDISEIEKKPYHIGGYTEFKPVFFGLDKKASLYKLKFYNRDEGSTLEEYNSTLQLEGSLEKGIARLFIKKTRIIKNHTSARIIRQLFTEAFRLRRQRKIDSGRL